MILLRSVLVLIARPSTALGFPFRFVANEAQTSRRERLPRGQGDRSARKSFQHSRDPARIQMAERPPSTDNSTPFTKLESSEARNSAAAAISSGRPIFPRGIRDSNIRFASSVRTWSCIGVAIGPGLSTFTRIFLAFSSLSQVRANERNAALLAAYTP